MNVELIVKEELGDRFAPPPQEPENAAEPHVDAENAVAVKMMNVESIIKQEFGVEDEGKGQDVPANPSPSHSVTSNSSSSNNGTGPTEDRLLLSALLTGSMSSQNRKRKSPPVKNSSFSSKDSETDEDNVEQTNFASKMLREMAKKRHLDPGQQEVSPKKDQEEDGNQNSGDHPLLKSYLSSNERKVPSNAPQFSIMSEERLRMQQWNSRPRSQCPICGDKANGLHYGIYSCEGCKNFFKRSVLIYHDRPYVCKFENNCSVSVLEIDGVKQKGPRCQACRYQACLDAGMYHSGVQRARGGRHATATAYNNAKNAETVDDATWRQNVIDGFVARLKANRETLGSQKFPRMQLPDIGARLHAAHYQNLLLNASDGLNGRKSDGDEVTVTITPSVKAENGVNGDHGLNGNGPTEEAEEDYEGYNVEMLLEEIKLWKSRHREVFVANEEKGRQIKSYQSQMSIMRRSLAEAKRRNSKNERKIESLEKNLESSSSATPGGESSQNPTLKALLSDTSFSRSISVTAAGNSRSVNEPKPSGSLTLTPVINPKKRGVAPAKLEDAQQSNSKPSSENEYDDEYCDDEPLEPTVIIHTDD